MNSLTLTDNTKDARLAPPPRRTDALDDEPWFDEVPPSSRRPTLPPVVHVGEFVGDPEIDGWLR